MTKSNLSVDVSPKLSMVTSLLHGQVFARSVSGVSPASIDLSSGIAKGVFFCDLDGPLLE